MKNTWLEVLAAVDQSHVIYSGFQKNFGQPEKDRLSNCYIGLFSL